MTGPAAAIRDRFTHPTRSPRPVGTELCEIYRHMVLFDFQAEIHAGFFVSYYRNFAVPSIARTLAGTGEMADALGLKRAPAALRLAFNAVLRALAVKVRARPLPSSPSFVPGTANAAVYPGGYTLDQIGPGTGVNAARD